MPTQMTKLLLLVALLGRIAVADEPAESLRARGHHKKVVGASLMIVGGLLDAATTALTFTGLARGGWSLTPKSSTDTTLLWTGVGGGFAVDSILTAGIVIYCDGGQLMHRANIQK
jgi:hypothetical protein